MNLGFASVATSYTRIRARSDVVCNAEGRRARRLKDDQSEAPADAGATQKRYFATCARGLGDILAAEIRAVVTKAVVSEASSGVGFLGDVETGYRAAMNLRTATRVLEEVASTECNPYDVYGSVKEALDWRNLIAPEQTFTVTVRSSSGREQGIRTRVKDSICDSLEEKAMGRPSPPKSASDADVTIFVSLHEERLLLYRDLGGDSLHKRGYRPSTIHASSLNECAAAGIAIMAGLGKRKPHGLIADPMCGSATLLIEAALLQLRMAPGLFRYSFPFESWQDYDGAAWELVREQALERELDPSSLADETTFYGSDIHPGAVNLARENISRAGISDIVEVVEGDASEIVIERPASTILSNPPWGKRLVEEDTAWKKLGGFLRTNARGGNAFILCGNPEVSRNLRMRASSKRPVRLGDIECRVLEYQIHNMKKTPSTASEADGEE